jgi:glycerol-3-phosphate dehydrogenase
LILDNPELREAIGENEFFFENEDGRIVLIFPMLDKVLIGTSDLPIENPDEAKCTEDEIEYFINMIKIVFPKLMITREQIVFMFSGVRPLPVGDAKKPGQISRDHRIEVLNSEAPFSFQVLNLIGGKWTSFRAFSEETTDKTLDILGLPRKENTRQLAIGGGADYPGNPTAEITWIDTHAADSGLKKERMHDLFYRYGTRAKEIAAYISMEPDRTLHHLPSYSKREIEFILKHEKVVHLDDFLLRRSTLAKLGDLTAEAVIEITKVMKSCFSMTDDEAGKEERRAVRKLEDSFGVKL